MPDAVVYLAAAGDRDVALLPVVGRPLGLRVIMAALGAGAARVHVPALFRDTLMAAAVARVPSARARVVWLDPLAPLPAAALLVVPAGLLVTRQALVPLLATPGRGIADERAPAVAAVLLEVPAIEPLWRQIAAGEPLGDAIARASACVEPARTAAVVRLAGPADQPRAARALLSTLGSAIDTWIDTNVHRRLARPFTLAAVRLGVSPNTITIASLLVGLAGAACFTRASAASATLGLAVYIAAVVLDHADGEVARLTYTTSSVGEWLDVAADTVVHVALVLALGYASARLTGAGAVSGVVAAAGVIGSSWMTKTAPTVGGPVGRLLSGLGNRDGFYAMLLLFILALAVFPPALPALMVLVAAGCHAYWIGRVLYRLRPSRGARRRKTVRNPK
jgi:phosphatidylglycerophosphate synthase